MSTASTMVAIFFVLLVLLEAKNKGWFRFIRFRRNRNTQEQPVIERNGSWVLRLLAGAFRLFIGISTLAMLGGVCVLFGYALLAGVFSAFESCARVPFEAAAEMMSTNSSVVTTEEEASDTPHEEENPLPDNPVVLEYSEEPQPALSDTDCDPATNYLLFRTKWRLTTEALKNIAERALEEVSQTEKREKESYAD